jgi:hypothetical protein
MKFMAITEATQQFEGRFIGFVGDRTLSKEPTLILLPLQKTWEWVKATLAMGGDSLLDYYERDPTWRSALWTPAADCTMAETNVPRFSHIPLVLFEMIRKEGSPLMPHNILALVLCYVKNSPPEQAQGIANTWQLVAQWCIMAAKKDPQGNSLVAFAIEAITKTNNTYFNQWVRAAGWHDGHTARKFTSSRGANGGDVHASAGSFCSGTWERGGSRPAGTLAF